MDTTYKPETKNNSSQDQYFLNENIFRAQLINRVMKMTTILAIVLFTSSQIRAFITGWTHMDLIYCFVFTGILSVLFTKHDGVGKTKTALILTLIIALAVAGTSTFGMLAGAIFFFPMAAVFIALFFSTLTVGIYGVLVTGYLIFLAVGFIFGYLSIAPGAAQLLSSPLHWNVYIMCFITFFMVTCTSIISYRQAIQKLIENVNCQREELKQKNMDLQQALNEISTLQGILPICSFCKKVRNDKGYWEQVDIYIHKNTLADISHSICPECVHKYYPEIQKEIPTKEPGQNSTIDD